ncbi:D(2) dopamine receptor-like [Acipenser ruthenus]|uniref:D(2) dopamine receptor-like n=1 Tax=Acipenser ruthenus TaxID=7906 RepID=UPI0027414337|nr:D(2) dopamine receptor-like [Acipenser ruthenus]
MDVLYEIDHVWVKRNFTPVYEDFSFLSIAATCCVLSFTFLAGIVGNGLVIWAVYRQKSLQTPTNALLVNLAVSDLLRCFIDCPLLIIIDVLGYNGFDLGIVLCHAQVFTFSLSSCVQLFTMASISAERYQAIAHPFKTSKRKKRVKISIPLTWALATLISIISVTLVKSTPVYVKCRGFSIDLTYYDAFGLYILVPVWFVTLSLITRFYLRIFFLVRTHAKKIFDNGTPPSLADKTKEPVLKTFQVMDNINCKDVNIPTELNQTHEEKQSGNSASLHTEGPAAEFKATSTNLEDPTPTCQALPVSVDCSVIDMEDTETPCCDSDTVLSEAGDPTANCPPEFPVVKISEPGGSTVEKTTDCPSVLPAEGRTAECLASLPLGEVSATGCLPTLPVVENPVGEIAGAVCMMPSSNRERTKKKTEGKLAKRSGYIILTFLAFWIPLILSVLINFFIYKNKSTIGEVEIFAMAVTCMTAATDPITYAVVNPQFRSEFKQLHAKFILSLCSRS